MRIYCPNFSNSIVSAPSVSPSCVIFRRRVRDVNCAPEVATLIAVSGVIIVWKPGKNVSRICDGKEVAVRRFVRESLIARKSMIKFSRFFFWLQGIRQTFEGKAVVHWDNSDYAASMTTVSSITRERALSSMGSHCISYCAHGQRHREELDKDVVSQVSVWLMIRARPVCRASHPCHPRIQRPDQLCCLHGLLVSIANMEYTLTKIQRDTSLMKKRLQWSCRVRRTSVWPSLRPLSYFWSHLSVNVLQTVSWSDVTGRARVSEVGVQCSDRLPDRLRSRIISNRTCQSCMFPVQLSGQQHSKDPKKMYYISVIVQTNNVLISFLWVSCCSDIYAAVSFKLPNENFQDRLRWSWLFVARPLRSWRKYIFNTSRIVPSLHDPQNAYTRSRGHYSDSRKNIRGCVKSWQYPTCSRRRRLLSGQLLTRTQIWLITSQFKRSVVRCHDKSKCETTWTITHTKGNQ